MKNVLVAFLFCVFFAFHGCAGQQFSQEMNSQIGILTYEDALIKWGPPVKLERGDRVVAAKWEEKRGIYTYWHFVVFDENKKMVNWKKGVGWEDN